jgi:hypothetical protein
MVLYFLFVMPISSFLLHNVVILMHIFLFQDLLLGRHDLLQRNEGLRQQNAELRSLLKNYTPDRT